MIETHHIIVLNSLKYSEDKLIVNALSHEAGRVTLLVRIAHSQRAAVRHTLFQPLSILEVQWEASPRATMFRPKAARPAVPLYSLQSDPTKTAIVMFLAEFLNHVSRENMEGGLLFDYISYALQWLDVAERGYANFHLVFLLRISRFLGIAPNIEFPAPYFDLREAEYTHTLPAHEYYIGGKEAEAIPTLLRMDFRTMHLFRLSGRERSRILEAVITYYRIHLPGIPEMKSLTILRDMFSK